MATVNGNSQFIQQGVLQSTWGPLTSANTLGTNEELPRYPYHSVQITGTFGGATVVLQGSDDGVTWFTLHDTSGSNISATSNARFDTIAIVPAFVRPSLSGGDGTTSVTLIVTSRTQGR